eukprot:CAMPEP_0119343408 /NCGR_PEP_ID=MMETSP1333-20130426/106432_1 /TAXON_ID=418940 /ORGANISM="Scyphosphaera apsteinii, Strain RCC1455" /LENGTH=685 /DNA_ID=CAMNT_0007355797 /DNA_START=23 /DNA_END=2080 /DNA_ORIENTATION=+
MLHFLALGVAFRLPGARPHAAVARTALVTMMPTNSYLESTIRRQIRTSKAPSHETLQKDMSSMQGSSQGSEVPMQSVPPPAAGLVPVAMGGWTSPPNSGNVPAQKTQPPQFLALSASPAVGLTPQQQPTPQQPMYYVAPAPEPEPEPDLNTRAVRVLGPVALVAGAVAGTLAYTSVTAPKPITMDELVAAQRAWGDAIVRISKTYLAGGDYVGAAAKAADDLYGYGRTDVLFKPTKASQNPFRPTGNGALSYFVGGDKVTGGYAEDGGFALNGGMGWKKVVFDNNQIDFNGATAQAMGEYYFYSAADDSVSKVEYTFGYKRNDDGKVRIYLHHSSLPYKKKPAALAAVAPITMDDLVAAQRAWGDAIVRISKTYLAGGDYVDTAAKAADDLYGYGRTNVLFKPTKAAENPFRPTGTEAMSYFVGGDKVTGGYAEDKGFALGPNGMGWKKVVFDNNQIDFNGATAQAMGEYYFYSAADDSVSKVEYTFGYKRNDDGKVRIYLHHSSLPYKKKPAALAAVAPITMDDLVAAQRAWGDAIVRISKTYLAGGDYVDTAAKAADDLYGYGRTNVLFKPTKAAENPFRPTGTEAMSYFVGGDKVTGGYAEDKGFALGPNGMGWKKVVFDNNQIDFNGATAQAMGEYYFYSAADDSVSKVEYTFGYKRNDDGKVRIYLHHSSLPYPGKKKPA